MARHVSYYGACCYEPPKPYGCFSFIFDIIMTVLTGGFWLIWIFAREMRRR